MEFEWDKDVNSKDICINKDLYRLIKDEKLSNSYTWSYNKTSIFFDNSTSAWRKDLNKIYNEIEKQIKWYAWKINDTDIYSFNYQAEKLIWTSAIEYFWYSDINKFIDYILSWNLKWQRIIYVTDDENFNYETSEIKNRNYNNLLDNKISIIKIWSWVKSYKQEINNILAATEGNIYQIETEKEVKDTVDNIMKESSRFELWNECTEYYNDNNTDKILAWIISWKLISNISSWISWEKIADIDAIIAKSFNIVNDFSSMIALETQEQKDKLENYSKDKDKYDVEYDKKSVERPIISNWVLLDESNSPVMFNSRPSRIYMEDSWSLRWWFSNSKISSDIKWIWSSSRMYYEYDSHYPQNIWVSLNFLWVLMLITYLIQIYSILNFITSYIRQK